MTRGGTSNALDVVAALSRSLAASPDNSEAASSKERRAASSCSSCSVGETSCRWRNASSSGMGSSTCRCPRSREAPSLFTQPRRVAANSSAQRCSSMRLSYTGRATLKCASSTSKSRSCSDSSSAALASAVELPAARCVTAADRSHNACTKSSGSVPGRAQENRNCEVTPRPSSGCGDIQVRGRVHGRVHGIPYSFESRVPRTCQ